MGLLIGWFSYGVVTALYNVIWSYIGYSNANYALSETRNPVRTLKIAAPTAIISVSIIYMLVNVRERENFFDERYLHGPLCRLPTLPPFPRTKSSRLGVFSQLRSSAMFSANGLNERSRSSWRYPPSATF